ncbi:acyltransferase [Eubacterium ramulus]|uniref:acyltransferase family protein n=1 Tax=Eubacterium ramulus TaxID=39490 RepID=UPI00101FCF19|nr:acyltransferase [Eubacterium ramulus]MSC77806.1 acyltransferase family protein [Eubacterium ramulus]MSC94012.1 acyltransferase family protein [Eubacterium ramulus]RYS98144.1 acyltransferase [Eubacterium ramulus]
MDLLSRNGALVVGKQGGLDRYRLIAAFLVIAIHTSPLLSVNENADFFLTRIFARMAVPLFLMITGRYVAANFWENDPDEKGSSAAVLLSFLKKIAILYGISVVLYLPVGMYAGHYKQITVTGIFRMLVFDGTFYHLWYFPACMLGMVIVWGCSRIGKNHQREIKNNEDRNDVKEEILAQISEVGFRITFVIVIILYILGLLGDSYYGLTTQIPVLKTMYDGMFQVFSYTRNGIFLVPIFLMIGVWFAKVERENTVQNDSYWEMSEPKRWNRKRAGLGLLISLVLMTVEGFALHAADWQRHDSMYVMLPIVMIFLYIWICAKPQEPSKKLRSLSTWIYILHPAVIVVVHALPGSLGKEIAGNSLLNYVAVVIGTCIISIFGMYVTHRISHGFDLHVRRNK